MTSEDLAELLERSDAPIATPIAWDLRRPWRLRPGSRLVNLADLQAFAARSGFEATSSAEIARLLGDLGASHVDDDIVFKSATSKDLYHLPATSDRRHRRGN